MTILLLLFSYLIKASFTSAVWESANEVCCIYKLFSDSLESKSLNLVGVFLSLLLLRGYKIPLARAFLNKVAAGKGTLEKQQKLYRKLLHTFYTDYEKCRFVCTLQSAAICRICFCIHVSSQPWPQLFFSCALPVEAKSKFIVLWLWCSSWAVLWIIRSCKATIFILTFPQQGVNVAWNEVRKQGQLIFN